jgi:hypothetical protein
MKFSRSLINSVVLAGLLLLIFAHDAHAYIDPGTGSYIFQLIIAGLLGAAFLAKVFWRNITTFFSNLVAKGRVEEDDSE